MNSLHVSANGNPVGTLGIERGCWNFAYADDWDEFPISPAFPLEIREFSDTGLERPVQWFFENLLPEGQLLKLIAACDGISSSDTSAILAEHGNDTAGALSISHWMTNDETPEISKPILRNVLHEHIEASRNRNIPLMTAWDGVSISLAGSQEKMGLRIGPDDEMYVPNNRRPSTHVIKPENTNPDFPFCPANEYFCMRLAQELKLPVPAVNLLHLPEPLYIIERFDRVLLPESHQARNSPDIKRIHQIDLCQALSVAPRNKYESDGGLGFQDLFKFLRGNFIESPDKAANTVIQWTVFNYLIGNLDAHAKNIAFLIQGQRAYLAPLYDMLCVEAYLPRQPMSMTIAGENKPGWVEGPHWDAMAYQAGLLPEQVRSILKLQSTELPFAIAKIIQDEHLLSEERNFLQRKVLPVIEERRAFVTDALKAPLLSLTELKGNKVLDSEIIKRLLIDHSAAGRL